MTTASCAQDLVDQRRRARRQALDRVVDLALHALAHLHHQRVGARHQLVVFLRGVRVHDRLTLTSDYYRNISARSAAPAAVKSFASLAVNQRIPPPTQFLNRELGILAFNRRVLAQAADESVPLLERLRFITIVSSNLDEFFEIRVAGLKEQIKLGLPELGPDGAGPAEVFDAVSREAHALVGDQYQLLNDEVLPALAAEGILFPKREDWNAAQRQWIRDYFFRELLPVLTPIGLDPAHPFPRVFNKSPQPRRRAGGRDAFGRSSGAAIVQAPRALPRVIRLPQEIAGAEHAFVFLSSILHAHLGELFAGMNVLGCYQFRVTRNSDLFVDEEEIKNLHTALQGELLHRHFGDAVRLEVADNCSAAHGRVPAAAVRPARRRPVPRRRPGQPRTACARCPTRSSAPQLKYPPFQPGLPPRAATRASCSRC